MTWHDTQSRLNSLKPSSSVLYARLCAVPFHTFRASAWHAEQTSMPTYDGSSAPTGRGARPANARLFSSFTRL